MNIPLGTRYLIFCSSLSLFVDCIYTFTEQIRFIGVQHKAFTETYSRIVYDPYQVKGYGSEENISSE